MEDVVSKHEAHVIIAYKFFSNDECLRKTVGGRLLCIFEMHSVVGPIAQEALEARQVIWRGNDKDVAYASKHQYADRVVDHWLVENRYELLAHTFGDRVEACARTTSENDSLHSSINCIMCVNKRC